MAKKRRQYTDAEIAAALAALAANGGNIKRTARELSVPRATLTKWRDTITIQQPDSASDTTGVSPECHQKKEVIGKLAGYALGEMSAVFKTTAMKMTKMLVKAARIARDKGHVAQISTAVGTMFDKAQLCDGNPTDIHRLVYENMNDDELDLHLQAVRSRQCQLALVERDGTTHPASHPETLQIAAG